MAGTKQINDYAAEYNDCMEVLDKELPEWVEPDPASFGPKVDEKKMFGVNTLFGEDEDEDETYFDMDKHWVGMPKCESKNLMPHKQLIVSFQTEEDMIAFGKLIGQKITMKTKSVWYPKRDPIVSTLNRWVDEGEVADDE